MQEQVGLTAVIPQKTVERSNQAKAKKKKTLAQLPVYRDACNMKYFVAKMMLRAPRKLTKFFDQMLMTASEVKKSIGMADISKNPNDRCWYLECARVLVQDLSDDFISLRKMELSVDKDTENKARAMLRGMIAQLVAWRDYTSGQGVQSVIEQ